MLIEERSSDSLFYAPTTVRDVAMEIGKEGDPGEGKGSDSRADERSKVAARICCSGAGIGNDNPGPLEKFIRLPRSRVISACQTFLIIQLHHCQCVLLNRSTGSFEEACREFQVHHSVTPPIIIKSKKSKI